MSLQKFLTPALLFMALAVSTALVSCDSQTAVVDACTSVLEYRDGDLLYTYHLPTGTEALFDLSKDPDCLTNLMPKNKAQGEHVRRQLEKKLKVKSLEDLRDENNPVLQSLKGLGYI